MDWDGLNFSCFQLRLEEPWESFCQHQMFSNKSIKHRSSNVWSNKPRKKCWTLEHNWNTFFRYDFFQSVFSRLFNWSDHLKNLETDELISEKSDTIENMTWFLILTLSVTIDLFHHHKHVLLSYPLWLSPFFFFCNRFFIVYREIYKRYDSLISRCFRCSIVSNFLDGHRGLFRRCLSVLITKNLHFLILKTEMNILIWVFAIFLSQHHSS